MKQTIMEKTVTVTPEMLAPHVGSGSLPVLATPVLAALFESAAAALAQEYLPEGIATVGTAITVRHNAPTPCRAQVTVRAELVSHGERDFRFSLSASDDAGPVAEGEHTRVSVKTESFLRKAEGRKASE